VEQKVAKKKEEDLTVSVITGPDVGGFVDTAAITVKIYPNSRFMVLEVLDLTRSKLF
jgi:hypothetical protein